MFGYIKAYSPELRLRENEYYRAAYCGLCRAMGKCSGSCSRMTLSYDMVFALLVRMAVAGTEPEFEKGHCALHPFKKRMFMKLNPELEYTAKAATVLAYGKLSDDVNDEKGLKKAATATLRALIKRGERRAAADIAPVKQKISEGLSELSRLEKINEPSVDTPADIFGEITAFLMSYGFGGADAKIAGEIGKRAGRWVYITDAADDCESDLQKGRYNPFLALYNAAPSDAQKKQIADALDAELSAIRCALDLVDRGERRDLFEILENVINYGMIDSAHKALNKTDKNGKGRRSERPV